MEGLGNGIERGNKAQDSFRCGDYQRSIEYAKQELCIAKNEKERDKKKEAAAYNILARSCYELRDYEQSREYSQQMLSVATEVEDKKLEIAAYEVLSRSYYRAEEYTKSIQYSNERLRIGKKERNRQWEVDACDILAWSYYEVGDYKHSLEYGKQQLAIGTEVGNREWEADACDVLAWSYYEVRDYKQSMEYGNQRLRIGTEEGIRKWEADAYNILARSYYRVGEYEKSTQYSKQLLSSAKEEGNRKWESDAYNILACSYYQVGEYEKSTKYSKQLLGMASEEGNRKWEYAASSILACSYNRVRDYKQCIKYSKELLRIAKEEKNGEWLKSAYEKLARSYYRATNYEQSIDYSKQLLNIATELGDRERKASAFKILAWSYHTLGDLEKAHEYSRLQKELQSEGLEDQSCPGEFKEARSEDAAVGGFSSGSSGLYDNKLEKKRPERGLERLNSGDFKAREDVATGGLPWDRSAVQPGYHPGTDDVYNMTARPRGITLIVNNKLFDDRLLEHLATEDPTRHGSEEDVRQVNELFNSLGFEVQTKENLTRLQLLNELDSFARQDHSEYDCFVLWLMSHGKAGEVFCSDGVTVPIQTANDMFSKCDTLSGKPKLFFIQACRGKEEDEGVAVTANISSSPVQPTSSHVDSPIDKVKPSASSVVPTHADFLYSFSTVDEHVSYRHKALGSYYVRALVETFQECAVYDHLLDILTTVNQKVSHMEATLSSVKTRTDIKVFKQIPEVRHTLRKKVRF